MKEETISIKATVYNLYPFNNERWYLEFGNHFYNYDKINNDSILILTILDPFDKILYETNLKGVLEYSIKKNPPKYKKFINNKFGSSSPIIHIDDVNNILDRFLEGGITL